MELLIRITLFASIFCFFAITGLCVAYAFGYMRGGNGSMIKRMFASSVVVLLVAVGGFLTYAFKYLTFSMDPYLGFTSEIREIQQVLKMEQVYPDHVDGVLGANTFRAIKDYQQKYELEATGAIDEKTLQSLFGWKERFNSPINNLPQELVRPYAVAPAFEHLKIQVMWLQRAFEMENPDGILRPEIVEAAKNFQSSRGLFNDGAIGFDTLLCAIEKDLNSVKLLKLNSTSKTSRSSASTGG
ncbi:peptidoglycan-binding protein [Pelomonas sp. KK5]|uniref:peptidoglycan-binding domain-containing protein n=1 Tax=Pelomonas sp. KK5 TaxID=1855730 RepID=UPI00097C80E6|nr:peptidoglycan-binding protein [Pelomonas sp. KK5]